MLAGPILPISPASAQLQASARDSIDSERGAAVANHCAAFLKGYQLYHKGEYDDAVAALGAAAGECSALPDYSLFYLASARRDSGHPQSAVEAFDRLGRTFPQSVLADRSRLEAARIKLKLGEHATAAKIARRLVARAADSEVRQGAEMVLARARLALGDSRRAYRGVMILRNKHPRGPYDAEARSLAQEVISGHPRVARLKSARYRRDEALLLLREGERKKALAQIKAAFRLAPRGALRADLFWLKGRALRASPDRAERAFRRSLKIAPHGRRAPAALHALGMIRWRANKPRLARIWLGRLVVRFRRSSLAPPSMLKIGRILEEEGKLDRARAEYRRLVRRYPRSDAAREARFRAPWMLYLKGRYPQAAAEFSRARSRTTLPSERDRFAYWEARALEKAGDRRSARGLLRNLATSVETNYYPALANLKVGEAPEDFSAAAARDPLATPAPRTSADARFHLDRALALEGLGLHGLERDELKRLEAFARREPELRGFVLAHYAVAEAWHDSIRAATAMATRRELPPEVAERLRYPRGFWNLIEPAARRGGIDPYLLLALARQESMFDPKARSRSDARGLMQLIPTTAQRVARKNGLSAASNDLYDPATNVRLGVLYLKSLLTMFGGDELRAVAAYNAGEHAVARWNARFKGELDEWVENIGFRQTRNYVKKVIGGRREYHLLYPRQEGDGSRSGAAGQSSG